MPSSGVQTCALDRKSTRLNSSHTLISYAVFCLDKKSLFTPQERGKYQGLFGAVFGIAFVARPLIGVWLTDNLSWHCIFYVNIPIVFFLMIGPPRILPPFPPKPPSRT